MSGFSDHAARLVRIALCFASLAPAAVRAGNDDEVFLGTQAPLSGGAVTATVNDGSALVYEPSGLVEGDDATIDISATALSLRVHRAENVVASPLRAGGDVRFMEFVSIPTTLAYTRTLSPRTRIGFGLFATRGAALRIRESAAYDGEGERTEYQFATFQRGSSIVLTAGIGHRITDTLRFGVSIAGVYDAEETTSLLAGARHVQLPAPATTDTITVQNATSTSRFGLRATFGLRFVPNERFRVAFSVSSPGLAIVGISSRSSAASRYSSRPVVPLVEHTQSDAEGIRFRAGMLAPLRIAVGLAFQVGRTSFALDGDFRPGANDRVYGLRRKHVLNARAGLRHALSETLAFGAGLFTDRNSFVHPDPSTDDRNMEPISGDERDFYGATLGVERAKARRLASSESARELRFVTTYALRYAFAIGNAHGVAVQPSLDATPDEPIASRHIRAVSHEVSLYIGSSLRF